MARRYRSDVTTESLRSLPPIPADPWESQRWEVSRLRHKMLTGMWKPELRSRIEKALGTIRAEAWGEPDLSSNVLLSVSRQLSILHDEPPVVEHTDETAAAVLLGHLSKAGWAPTMQTFVADLVAIRDIPLRVDVVGPEGSPTLVLRPMRADLTIARASTARPDVPTYIREARPARGGRWWWEVIDIRDPENPVYRAEDTAGADISAAMLGTSDNPDGDFTGDRYPWRRTDGRPILPVVLYHAARRPYLWDYEFGAEVVDGTFQAGVLMTFFMHSYRSASWEQRWMAGGQPAGASPVDEDGNGSGRRDVVADPAAVLIIEPMSDTQGGIQVGQWAQSADVQAMLATAMQYEERIATFAGVSASDFIRTSGDPRSGYSLSISQEGRRQAARKLEPTVRDGDEQLASVAAVLLNGHSDLGLPEDGYRVQYATTGPTPSEMAADRENVLALRSAGLMSRARAYAKLNRCSLDEARRELAEIDAEDAPDGATIDASAS